MSQSAKQVGGVRGRVPGARAWKPAALLALSLALGACGGGGGGGDEGTDGGTYYTPGDGPGTAVVVWAAPAEREDGRALVSDEIGGYRIHFGPLADPEQYVIEVNGGTASQYSVTGLDPDTWTFSVSVVDTDGQESAWSNAMTKVINS